MSQGTYMVSAVTTTERAVISKSTVMEALGGKATMVVELIKTILLKTQRMRGQGTVIQVRRKGIRRTQMRRNKTMQRKKRMGLCKRTMGNKSPTTEKAS